jgi:hypothetical protein
MGLVWDRKKLHKHKLVYARVGVQGLGSLTDAWVIGRQGFGRQAFRGQLVDKAKADRRILGQLVDKAWADRRILGQLVGKA